MNFSQTRFRKVLSIIVFISLISGLTVSASAAAAATILESPASCKPVAGTTTSPDSSIVDCCPGKIAASSETSRAAAKPVDDPPCCGFGKVAADANSTTPLRIPECCEPPKIAAHGTNSSGSKVPVQRESCCLPPSKVASNISGDPPPPPPCPTPPPPAVTSCDLALPPGSIVGAMAYDTQAYWAPGKISPDVMVSAGTYWVIGIGTAENGDKFYELLLGCEYVFVPLDAMQPSYQPPWNGEPLPTTPVEV